MTELSSGLKASVVHWKILKDSRKRTTARNEQMDFLNFKEFLSMSDRHILSPFGNPFIAIHQQEVH